MNRQALGCLAVGMLLAGAMVRAEDWPQWGGVHRDNKSAETGLLKSWPTDGPALLWSGTNIGKGYSGVAVAKGVTYVVGENTMTTFDPAGKIKWQQHGKAFGRDSTPTVDGDLIFVRTPTEAASLDAETGSIKWECNTIAKFQVDPKKGNRNAESLLVDGNNLILTVGGTAGLVAVNKLTGETVWQSTVNDYPAWCSPELISCGKRKIVVTMMFTQMVGVDAGTGALLWSYPVIHSNPVYCNTPVLADGVVFSCVSQGWGDVGLQLADDGASVKEAYHKKDFAISCGGFVELNGYAYAATDSGGMCLKIKTGEKAWGPDKGGIFYSVKLLKLCRAG